MAGIYTKELFDQAVASVISIDPIHAYGSAGTNWWTSPPDGLFFQYAGGVAPGGVVPNLIDLFVRPHTKEELQAADLWPWPA